MKSVLISTLAAYAQAARRLDGDLSIPFSPTLNCGKCIKGGFNFCTKGPEAEKVSYSGAASESMCCLDETCTSNPDYHCSSAYESLEYSYNVCPFFTKTCNARANFAFTGRGQHKNIEIGAMAKGDVCCYQGKTQCDAPGI